jgi:hypothetical protein
MTRMELEDWLDELLWNLRHPRNSAKMWVSALAGVALLAAEWYGAPGVVDALIVVFGSLGVYQIRNSNDE